MHIRKKTMYDNSDAFLCLPGGIGTLEEVSETTKEDKKNYKNFMLNLQHVLPCKYCRMNLKNNLYTIGELKLKYGLNTDTVWFESFTVAPEKQVHYIRKMRKNGEELNQEPRILLSTIHGVKGGEADNVVLLTDLSKNTQSNYERYPDDENRLFYVGATRTKNHLHIVRPKDIYKSYRI